MREIKAVVQLFKMRKIREAFRHLPEFPGMTISRVEGCSFHPEDEGTIGIKGELADYSSKYRIEIIAPEHMVNSIVAVIREQGSTGQKGDGLIWVTPVEQALLIRDGQPIGK